MNDMDALLWISLALALLLAAFLLYRLVSLERGAKRLAVALADIRKSGFRRRLHLGFSRRPLVQIGTELNALLDDFQSALEDNLRLELSHRRLIADISHDIRTPLTSLLGYVEVLREREPGAEERREYLDIVYAKAGSMHRMIEAFFDLARLEAGDDAMELARVDLAEIVRDVLASFYQDFQRSNVAPEIRLPEEPVAVWGNRAGIERVLGNLLSNALKYGGEGGVIGVAVREEEDRAWVDVTDRGCGIPESELPRVFDRLYTADASRNSATRGAGLGLAIARRLVEKQGGEIAAESRPGERTAFSFCLMKRPN